MSDMSDYIYVILHMSDYIDMFYFITILNWCPFMATVVVSLGARIYKGFYFKHLLHVLIKKTN